MRQWEQNKGDAFFQGRFLINLRKPKQPTTQGFPMSFRIACCYPQDAVISYMVKLVTVKPDAYCDDAAS